MSSPLAAFTARLASLPLVRRLALLIAGCAGLTALLCMLAFVATAWWQQQAQARDEAAGVVRTLAYALQAPVAFQDAKGVADALAVLRARPSVSDAWVHDAGGKLLGQVGGARSEVPHDGGGLLQGRIVAEAPVVVDGAVVGRVVIVNRLTKLWASLAIALGAMLLGTLAAFTVSVAVAQRVARAITDPVTTLAQASQRIAQSHDYGQRLPAAGGDEVGTAVRAFNDMLDEIQARGDALREANRVLEQRVAERTLALRSEKERAEQASIAKTRFLANMSHELRTPLNAVIGAAQLLGDGDHDERADRWHLVEAIRSSGINLLGLIENILDLSRIESGALELASEDFDLVDCAEAAATTLAVTARIKGLQTACIVDPRVEGWRHGDALRLRQVMLNLLGNAMKFTERGEVVLRVRPGASSAQAVRIDVVDTGIGIPESSRERIFEPFRQADDGSSRRYGGSGLGLAIAAQLVRAMGGRIDVASEPGLGSTFGFEIVLPTSRLPGPRPPVLQQRVAYHEPHGSSAEALAALLQRTGCSGTRVADAGELRSWLDGLSPGPRPWLLVAVDSDGGERLLDEAARWFEPGRIVGMTRHHTATLERSQADLGLSGLLIKPLLRSSLSVRLGSAGAGHGHAADTTPEDLATAAALARSPHVLVVEDDHINQTIVCSMLQRAGYRTSAAFDGASALRQVARQRFDLVLMDWQMPDMDGLEVTRRLRAGAAGRGGLRVPIVALTANAFAEDRLACLAAGMNDFLTKPVLAANLSATVGRWAHAERNLDSVFDGAHTVY